MAILGVIKVPDLRLRRIAQPVEDVGSVQSLIDDMLETMYAYGSRGLASIQVGRLESVVVIDVSDSGDAPLVLVNPVVAQGTGRVPSLEQCASVPSFAERVERLEVVTVSALDRHGTPITIESDGALAMVIQHEIDHLHGLVYIDHLSRLKRELILQRSRRASR